MIRRPPSTTRTDTLFPTRRSSDLLSPVLIERRHKRTLRFLCIRGVFLAPAQRPEEALKRRSEEHTSELQSLMRISYAVFCLKKKKTIHHTRTLLPTIKYITNMRQHFYY